MVNPTEKMSRRARLIGLVIDEKTKFHLDEMEDSEIKQSSSLEPISLDLSDSVDLKFVVCRSERIKKARLHRNRSLIYLNVAGSNLDQLDVSGCGLLEWLDCRGLSKIDTLDVSRNPSLRYIDCRGTGVTKLDLSRCPVLKKVLLSVPKSTNGEPGNIHLTLRGIQPGKWRLIKESGHRVTLKVIPRSLSARVCIESKHAVPDIILESDGEIREKSLNLTIVDGLADRHNRCEYSVSIEEHRRGNYENYRDAAE